jgi:CheY-like chemotaxis protein
MSAIGSTPATILIVDDDPNVREMLHLAFAAQGYRARAVSTSMEVLELLDAGAEFDVMIMDVLMPGIPRMASRSGAWSDTGNPTSGSST